VVLGGDLSVMEPAPEQERRGEDRQIKTSLADRRLRCTASQGSGLLGLNSRIDPGMRGKPWPFG
jgi:hypothetical protein